MFFWFGTLVSSSNRSAILRESLCYFLGNGDDLCQTKSHWWHQKLEQLGHPTIVYESLLLPPKISAKWWLGNKSLGACGLLNIWYKVPSFTSSKSVLLEPLHIEIHKMIIHSNPTIYLDKGSNVFETPPNGSNLQCHSLCWQVSLASTSIPKTNAKRQKATHRNWEKQYSRETWWTCWELKQHKHNMANVLQSRF